MVDCRHRRRGRDRGDRRRLGADVTLDRPYIDCIDWIALCAAAGAFALASDQAMPKLLPGRYALALELCSARSDVPIPLPRFLDEASSMRKAGRRKNPAAETKVGSGRNTAPIGEPTRRPSIEARVMLSFARAAGHPGFWFAR